jgi:uncharacterized protein YaiI (UPF0178 family)
VKLFLDGDACPVKDEAYDVAARYRVPVTLVANKPLALPPRTQVEMVVVGDSLDAADDWIAEHAAAGDVVVTADIPLAARCLAAGALVLGTNGREFTEDSIGGALAMRDLKSQLRESGTNTGGPRALSDQDRSRFRMKLDELVTRGLRRRPER